MRITREQLLKVARNQVKQLAQNQERLVCVYLTGSLLDENPFLGGSTDIDLIMVHAGEPEVTREVLPFSDEVHFDIAHLPQALFSQPRHLRNDPWIGSFFCLNPQVFYDTRHWFEFTQASICAQFDLPDYVLNRSRSLAAIARENWVAVNTSVDCSDVDALALHLRSLENAGNAFACLSGAPLTRRRYLLNLEERAEAVQRPGLYAGLLDLLGASELKSDTLRPWLDGWKATLEDASRADDCPASLANARLLYFTEAVDAMLDDEPQSALWIMLNTWTRSLQTLGCNHPSYLTWQAVCRELGFSSGNESTHRAALDTYLDSVEETIDTWASNHYL